MSHYTVMAILRKESDTTLEELLAPYDENMDVAPYVRRTKAEVIARKREEAAEVAHDILIAASVKDAEEYKKQETTYIYDYVTSDAGKAVAKLVDATDEEVFAAAVDDYGEECFDKDGNYISTYNPKSKWDWYQVGGRWAGSLALKNGGRADEAKAGDIDWKATLSCGDEDAEKRVGEFWDEYVLGKLPEDVAGKSEKEIKDYLDGKFGFILFKREYYLEHYGSKEEYVSRATSWSPYAVLDDKGWHAPGEMGWFGCSLSSAEADRDWENNFRADFIDTLDPEDEIIIVDCHI